MSRTLNGSRVWANTRWLYLRLAVETVTELVAARILLSSLGSEGFGLFAAVAGSIGSLGFLLGALEAAARRFLCCDFRNFAPLLGLTLMLAALLCVAGVGASFAVLPHAVSVSLPATGIVLVRFLRLPYETCIVADERMGFFLAVSLAESALTLMTALLVEFLPFEPVAAYATLRFASFVLAGCLVAGFCLRRHPISRTLPVFRLDAVRALCGFFGWNALGSVAGLLKGSGIVILLADYAGTVGCAAYEAAGKFSVLLWGLVANYRMAYLPGIVKAWSANDRDGFVSRTRRAFVHSLVGMSLVTALILCFAPQTSRACLGGTLPEGTAAFLRMVALQFFFEALATPLDTAILATGRIARYEIVLTSVLGSSFFLAWLFLSLGLPPWTAVGAVAFVNGFAFLYRFVHLKAYHGIAIREWFCRCVP